MNVLTPPHVAEPSLAPAVPDHTASHLTDSTTDDRPALSPESLARRREHIAAFVRGALEPEPAPSIA